MIERYTRPRMGALWTTSSRLNAWLEVELAVCEAWWQAGRIDDASLNEIKERAAIDAARVLEIEAETRHDLIAFLSALEEKVGPASRFIHLGCTSSDIVDTANALQLVRAGRILLEGFDALLAVLKSMAYKYKGVPCIGRTHGVHAEPSSFGLKLAGFYAEFLRHKERFSQAVEGVRVGKLSGAVGTYTLLTPEVERTACTLLGLEVDPISTQIVQRDRYAHYFTALALAAGGIERLCIELRHLQRTEVLEVEEGFAPGQKGSSAMPHKKNPISAENLSGLSRLVRSNSLAAMENTALWHERDISHSSVERVIMPDSTILMDYMLHRLSVLLERLQVHPEAMRRNMLSSHGLFFSQRVLNALLGKTDLTRQAAYALVQRLAMQSWEKGLPFPDLVRQDPTIGIYLDKTELDKLFDLSTYLAHENMIFSRVFS